ncbi:MAG: aminopeptidase P family protein, partial [Deltaproteobacteria bacterium]|nr:aminopeptidase P family protein [Deltaproteobacteria bacterium]
VENIVAGKEGDVIGELVTFVKNTKLGNGRIELDVTFMPGSFYRNIRKALDDADIDEDIRIVAGLREIKTEEEITLIKKGLVILSKAHDRAMAAADEGVSEIDIAQEIRHTILSQGADYTTALFVDAGLRSTIPLASPMASNHKLRYGEMVLISIFCVYKNYSAGMDRAWVVGEPSEMQRRLADIELKTLEKALSLVKAGASTTDFMKPVYYDFAEPMLKKAGIKGYNIQGYVGHGTGVKIFEAPVLWKLNPTVLKPGMVIDMEPGMYAKDSKIGGMRTSEFIVVTDTGYEILFEYPRRIGSWNQGAG